jgi:formylglycine-generating enzyme required for sulfatase activity/tRNA A-37 threonylcarbamoyl transferase component Bud32
MSDLIGKTLAGRYCVDSFIGRGGMAEVYKVWDQERAVYLALKLLREDLAQDRIFLRRFKREADTLAKLQHPNIVRFYGLERDGLFAFILMDYVEGSNLRSEIFQLDGQPIELERMRTIIRPVCSALHFAHRMGMVHCDLKPGNIMLQQNGGVLVADFGIARMTDAATTTMVGMGTPAYMAPEQARGLDPIPQTDIYALGIVLFEMFTGGERPFTGEQTTITGTTSEKVRWEQVNLKPPSPKRWNPDISSDQEELVLRCLEKDPFNRFGSPLDLSNALELALGKKPRKIEQSAKINMPAESEEVVDQSVSRPKVGFDQRSEVGKIPWWQRWYLWAVLGLAILLIAILAWPKTPKTVVEVVVETVMVTVPIAQSIEDSPNKPTEPILTQPTKSSNRLTPTPTIHQLGIGSTMVSSKDNMVEVYVPAGEFTMGSANGDEDELPIHTVYLDEFWIDQTEVTNAMFATFLNELDNQIEGEKGWLDALDIDAYIIQRGGNWQPINYDFSDHPVVEVSWYGARAYCEWAGRRLPTESEWEKAAKGSDNLIYPWGSEINCSFAQFGGCDEKTVPVGSFPNGVSPFGVLDMAGNVWEWVADWYAADFYSSSPLENPAGPVSGKYRVLRGGSWLNDDYHARTTYRTKLRPTDSGNSIGFRCAYSP